MNNPDQQTPSAVRRAGRREWAGLAVLALACLLYAMDLTVLHLAVPSLSADLRPSIGQQLIRAGRVDELHVHLVPVLFGAGTRLFENLGDDHIQLQMLRVIEGATATHLRYAVVKRT